MSAAFTRRTTTHYEARVMTERGHPKDVPWETLMDEGGVEVTGRTFRQILKAAKEASGGSMDRIYIAKITITAMPPVLPRKKKRHPNEFRCEWCSVWNHCDRNKCRKCGKDIAPPGCGEGGDGGGGSLSEFPELTRRGPYYGQR